MPTTDSTPTTDSSPSTPSQHDALTLASDRVNEILADLAVVDESAQLAARLAESLAETVDTTAYASGKSPSALGAACVYLALRVVARDPPTQRAFCERVNSVSDDWQVSVVTLRKRYPDVAAVYCRDARSVPDRYQQTLRACASNCGPSLPNPLDTDADADADADGREDAVDA